MTTTVQPHSDASPATVGEALRHAFDAVNAAYADLPPAAQDALQVPYDGLDLELDRAILAADRDRAFAATRAWSEHWLHEIAKAAGA